MYFHPFLFQFGMLGHNVDQIKELDGDVQRFKKTKKEAVFTLYLGCVNHWVCVIVHKTRDDMKFYLMDSSNLHFLEKVDEQLPEVMIRRSREKELYGMKPHTNFFIKMAIQSLFDIRKSLEIL